MLRRLSVKLPAVSALLKIARRLVPQRARLAVDRGARRLRARLYAGEDYCCPCCGGRFRKLLSFGAVRARENVVCPGCGSNDRHRLLWMYLKEKTDFFTASHRVLHFAPEDFLQERFASLPNLDYRSADLHSPLAMDRVDITALPYQEAAFDVILCCHVLEHVPDDRQAISEIHRVLRPGGWAILQVPFQSRRERTYEDPAITDPAERQRVFGQKDHLRIYGQDYSSRLGEAGFQVTQDGWVRQLPREFVETHRLERTDIFLCQKPA
jgi:SAM-dependent methyltransferase